MNVPKKGSKQSLNPEFFKKLIEGKEHQQDKELVSYLYDPNEEDDDSTYLPQKKREKWSRVAFWLSVVSTVVYLIFSLASFLVCQQTNSSSVFANAFDALLGTVSSFAVAWRFRDLLNGDSLGRKRERIATVGIGVGFVATGIATVAASVIHLTDETHTKKTNKLLIILTCSLVVFLMLSYVQTFLAKKLDSQSLRAASADNGLAAAMAFGILVSTLVYRNMPKLWWLDHSVAMFLGVISGGYGIYLLVLNVMCNKEFFDVNDPEAKPLNE